MGKTSLTLILIGLLIAVIAGLFYQVSPWETQRAMFTGVILFFIAELVGLGFLVAILVMANKRRF